MNKGAVAVAFALLVAACSSGGDAEPTSSSTSAAPSTTATTTTTEAPTTTSTTTEPTTTTATTSAPAGTAVFVLTTVAFGESPLLLITNVGDGAGELGGHWLCQRPSYHEIPPVTLQPGEQAAISLGGEGFTPPPGAIVVEGVAGLGSIDSESGEMGLYQSADFGSTSAIVDYVEWGTAGHGRTSVAVGAGIWTDGDFVPTSAASSSIVALTTPTSAAEDWGAEG